MKHFVIATLLAVGAVGGYLLFGGGSGGDLLAERDRFVREEALVVEFAPRPPPGEAPGPSSPFAIHLPGTGWISDGGSSAREGLFTGDTYLREVAEGCYLEREPFDLPLIPGISVARELLHRVEIERDGETVSYTIAREHPFTLDVTEDLSRLQDDGVVVATTRGAADGALNGTLTLRRATEQEVTEARAVLESAKPSEFVEVTLRQRLLWASLVTTADVQGTWGNQFHVVIRDCPEQVLWASASGLDLGARLLGTTYDITIGPNRTAAVRDAVPLAGPFDGYGFELTREVEAGESREVPFRVGSVFALRNELPRPTDVEPWEVWEVVACQETEWFRCGRPSSVKGGAP